MTRKRGRPRVTWVVLDAIDQVIRCLRCGEARPLSTMIPAPVTQFVRKSDAFTVLHEDCQPKEKPDEVHQADPGGPPDLGRGSDRGDPVERPPGP